MAEEPPAGRSFQIIPLICASLTDALGLLTFFGWVSGLPLLASVRAKYIPRPRAPLFAFPSLWAAPKALAKSPIPQKVSMTTFAWWEWKCSIRIEVAKRRRAAPLFVILSEGSRTCPVASASKKPAERNAI
jgi:hypothetical protein